MKEIKKEKIIFHSDSTGNIPRKTALIDSTKNNRYNDLLEDDPEYNKKYPPWKPALQIVGMSMVLNVVDRSVLNLEFAKVDFYTWRRTTRAGFP